MNTPHSPDPDWAVVDALFRRALELPAAERDAFLQCEAAGNAGLQSQLRRLLAASEAGERLLDRRDAMLADLLDDGEADEREAPLPPGTLLAGYGIVRLLGEGGMARVYLAEQQQAGWRREVAIKLIHSSSGELARRFRSESRILAGLEHPGIARLIDTGVTDDGLPFLVTEYVDGTSITRWCREHDSSLRERLHLFLQLADALQYAHGRLVIHRDLKPSNVLVDGDDRVRLLDFGIARLDAGGDDPRTRTGLVPMTPEYAAPEQLIGSHVGTAADIYQLGLLLFELLVGEAAWKHWKTRPGGITRELPAASATVQSGALAQDAERRKHLQQNARALRGDLDAIIARATNGDPQQRYPTVQVMADDIRAHLAGRRISLRREGVARTVWRFARNNRLVATTAAGLLLALLGWALTLQLHSRQLLAEREAAQAQANRAERVKSFLIDVFRAPDLVHGTQHEAGANVTLLDILPQVEDKARHTLTDEPDVLDEMLDLLATLYNGIGQDDEGRRLTGEVLDRLQTRQGANPLEIAHIQAEYARQLAIIGDLEQARPMAEQAVAVVDADPHAQPGTTVAVWLDMAHVLSQAHAHSEREALMRRMLDWLGSDGSSPVIRAEARQHLASALINQNKREEALAVIEPAIDAAEQELGTTHFSLVPMLSHHAWILSELGRHDDAWPKYERAIAITRKLGHQNHPATSALRNNLALTLGRAKRHEDEQAILREIVAERTQTLGPDHFELANAWQNLGASLVYTRHFDEAESALLEARRIYIVNDTGKHPYRAFPLISLSSIHLENGRFAEVVRVAGQARRELEPLLPPTHPALLILDCRLTEARQVLSPSEQATAAMRQAAEAISSSDQVRTNPSRRKDLNRCRTAAGLPSPPSIEADA